MGLIIRSGNDALKVNPPTGDDIALSVHGSDWLWAVCACYCALLLFARQGEKIFHYLFTISLFTGAIAYFAMASDLGSTPIITELGRSGTREIFYARYINWCVSSFPSVTCQLVSSHCLIQEMLTAKQVRQLGPNALSNWPHLWCLLGNNNFQYTPRLDLDR
jgi:bacteriorhodopsin